MAKGAGLKSGLLSAQRFSMMKKPLRNPVAKPFAKHRVLQ